MGNRVIGISDTDTSAKDEVLEVYRDVSMVSQRRLTHVLEGTDENVRRVPRQRYFVSKDVNVKAVFNSLGNIFGWIPGERVLNPDFGSRLALFLYEGITPENREKIAAEVRGACMKWEPRVSILKVTPVEEVSDTEDNTVRIDILFTIPSLSREQYQYSYIYDRTR